MGANFLPGMEGAFRMTLPPPPPLAAELRYPGRDVQDAKEQILNHLQNKQIVYFDGWNGFGATAVLRSLAFSNFKLPLTRIIFIDCSEWKNARATQREIAKELKLDSSAMALFDKQDEEDDFRGVNEGSRDEILSVAQMILETLTSHKFIMIFLNGSDDEVDVTRFGIPQFTKFTKNRMIWTFSRRFLTMNNDRLRLANKQGYTHVFMYQDVIKELDTLLFQELLHQEVAAIVAHIPCILEIDPKMVEDCCLYDLFVYYFHTTSKFSWVGHASNYWICDQIIQGDRENDISNALRQEINWKCDASLLEHVIEMLMRHLKPLFLVLKDDGVYEEGSYRWISVTSKNRKLHGMQTIPAVASSFFLAFERSNIPPTLPNGFFKHSRKLGVLVLCSCAFNFASPPFCKCHSLRFLGLDHCTHSKTAEGENHTEWTCLNSLLVLDQRYTHWNEILSGEKIDVMTNIRELNIEGVRSWQYVAQLQGRLPKLQRIRIIKPPTCPWETSDNLDDSFIDKTSMEVLDWSGNCYMKTLPTSLSKARSLQMLILDGCDGLENIVVSPPSLRSFSFDGYGPASQRTTTVELPPEHFRPSSVEDENDISISRISLEGCTKLDNLFVRGLNNLVELDLSGTAIKILDFKTMVVEVPRLKRLFLIGCKHLRAIIFLGDIGSKLKPDLELLCMDTRAGIMCPKPSIDKTKSFRLQVHAIVVDARIARTLAALLSPYLNRYSPDIYYNIHATSSSVYDWGVQSEETNSEKYDYCDQGNLQQIIPSSQYSDVLWTVGDPPMMAFPQPPATRLDRHIEIGEGSCYVESEESLGKLMKDAESLHLHDASIHHTADETIHMQGKLRWCRVERCPKLDIVFPLNSLPESKLETFWASDLLMARWIWGGYSLLVLNSRVKGPNKNIILPETYSFFNDMELTNLQHLHLRSCPRLQFALPVSSFPNLETLHIIHCGNLGHVFILYKSKLRKITTDDIVFPKLKTIHLHDLPKLHQICEVKMVTPALKSIKVRGCWNLRKLPSVAARGRGEKKPSVEIEKDVWDALKWDDDHHPNHYEAPIHSRYYKKKLPRVSFLR